MSKHAGRDHESCHFTLHRKVPSGVSCNGQGTNWRCLALRHIYERASPTGYPSPRVSFALLESPTLDMRPPFRSPAAPSASTMPEVPNIRGCRRDAAGAAGTFKEPHRLGTGAPPPTFTAHTAYTVCLEPGAAGRGASRQHTMQVAKKD